MTKSNPTQIACIGGGYWGKNLIRNLYDLGVLSWVCEVDAERRAELRATYPSTEFTDSTNRVFGDPNTAGVVIATPAASHGELVRQALLADKDVFVEKPLCLSVEEGKQLVALAFERRRVLMVGHLLWYHPAVLQLKKLVEEGELGRVHYISSHRLNLGKIRREENILWSFAPHDIAIILRLMGRMPFQVAAYGGSYVQPNIADVTVTHLLFDNGVRAHIHVSWLHPFKEQRLVVVGSRQMASFDDVAKRLVLYDQRVELQEGEPVPIQGAGEEIPFAPEEPLRLECQAFLEALVTRRPPITDGPSGLRVLKV